MLPDLQWEINKNTFDTSPHLESVQLFLLEFCEGTDLVNLSLLLGHLRLNRLLVYVEPLAFDVVSRCELIRFALGILVGETRNHSKIV